MYKVGIASTDGIVVNQHFGKADCFHIIQVSENGDWHFVENRTLLPVCEGGDHDEDRMLETIHNLLDIKYLLVSRVGFRAEQLLEQNGIQVFELPGFIEDSLDKMFSYIELQKLLS